METEDKSGCMFDSGNFVVRLSLTFVVQTTRWRTVHHRLEYRLDLAHPPVHQIRATHPTSYVGGTVAYW
jgi:hypothetical protein